MLWEIPTLAQKEDVWPERLLRSSRNTCSDENESESRAKTLCGPVLQDPCTPMAPPAKVDVLHSPMFNHESHRDV